VSKTSLSPAVPVEIDAKLPYASQYARVILLKIRVDDLHMGQLPQQRASFVCVTFRFPAGTAGIPL
jgi:hypothetical protein